MIVLVLDDRNLKVLVLRSYETKVTVSRFLGLY